MYTNYKMEEFKKILSTSEKISEVTLKNYLARLRFVEKTFQLPIDEIDLTNVKDVVSRLESVGSSQESMRAYITAILKYMRALMNDKEAIEQYSIYHKNLSKTVKEENMKNEMTEKEEKNYMPYETIREKFIEWFDTNKSSSKFNWNDALFIGNFLLLKAPVRLGNWRNMKVIYIDKSNMKNKLSQLSDEFNYLLVINNKMQFEFIYVFNNYKTSAFLGDIHVVVEDERLKEMLLKVALPINEGEFINNIKQSVQSNKLKRLVKKILGVEMSIDGLRHSFITDLYDNKRINAIERREILTLFGHKYNPSTTDLYYKKTNAE